ncbi:MAG: hypothetical protein ACI9CP_000151 [Cryomorphaceae bacterium]|jgi:hypothetical protein
MPKNLINDLTMKKLKSMFIACMVFSSLTSIGQAEGSLSMKENGTFEIPSTELREVYSLDISSLDLESFGTAIEFFSEKNTNLVMFRPNTDATTAMVFLQVSKKPQWTVSDWNDAISDINLLDF